MPRVMFGAGPVGFAAGACVAGAGVGGATWAAGARVGTRACVGAGAVVAAAAGALVGATAGGAAVGACGAAGAQAASNDPLHATRHVPIRNWRRDTPPDGVLLNVLTVSVSSSQTITGPARAQPAYKCRHVTEAR